MKDLEGPAIVKGRTDEPLEFKNLQSGQQTIVKADSVGKFRIMLPEGKYLVKNNTMEQTCSFLPAGTYDMDLRSDNAFTFEVSGTSSANGEITVTAIVRGNGSHQLAMKTHNLTIREPVKHVNLKSGERITLKWHCKIESEDEPWVAVLIPDKNIANHKELTGPVLK
jgi:hypothetical protein